MSTVRDHLPWWVLVVALTGCAVALFGPLWSTAAGENPLERAPGPDYAAIVALSVPTLVMAVLVPVTALWARRRARDGS